MRELQTDGERLLLIDPLGLPAELEARAAERETVPEERSGASCA